MNKVKSYPYAILDVKQEKNYFLTSFRGYDIILREFAAFKKILEPIKKC